MSTPSAIFWVIGSYLVGSISFALLMVRWVKGVDLRQVGSGNLGATNASRVLGRRLGIVVYLLDLLKGFVPAWIGLKVLDPLTHPHADWLPMGLLMGLAAFLGHCFPFYLRFRGGKGVATASGMIIAGSWMAFAWAFAAFTLLTLVTRMVSVGSMAAAIVVPVAYLATERQTALRPPGLAWLTAFLLIAIFVLAKHRKNIQRIVEGTEPRIGSNRP